MRQRLTLVAVFLFVIGAFGVVPRGWAEASQTSGTLTFTGSDFFIPRPATATDQDGVRRLLVTYDLAANGQAELIGASCRFNVSAANGESVHLNNHGVIATGGAESDVLLTEAEAFVTATRLEDASLTLGPTIELYNVMLPDANETVGTSVDYVVTVTCSQTTTTTVPETTTTEAETTTTEATTTTTEATTTTLPTTTVPDQTTTTAISLTTVTTAPPSPTPSTLPATDRLPTAALAMIGFTMLAAGAAFLVTLRGAKEESE